MKQEEQALMNRYPEVKLLRFIDNEKGLSEVEYTLSKLY